MSLPLPSLSFYRLADQSPAAATIAALLDAIYTALTASTDYRGTSIPSTHIWTIGRQQAAGVTKAVYATAPSGTAMGLAPMIIIAGDSGAPTPTMASPDSFVASNVLVGIAKNAGAWAGAWDGAAPATSGSFSGYWRAGGTTWNSTLAKARVYVSEEVIVVQLIGSTVTNQALFAMGAWCEPHTSYSGGSGLTAETDDRLYGMWATGTAVWDSGWLSTTTGVASSPFPWTHSTSAGAAHCMVFQPGASTLYTCGRKHILQASAATAEATDSAGVLVGDLVPICRTSATVTHNGARLGMARGTYTLGSIQSGKTSRNGSTDLYHVLAPNTSAASDALMLRAAA